MTGYVRRAEARRTAGHTEFEHLPLSGIRNLIDEREAGQLMERAI